MGLLARDVMNVDVISVPASMDLRDLAKLFLEKGITGAPVIYEDGNLAGVISQTDLIYYSLTRSDQLVLESDFYQTARMEGRHVPTGFQIQDTNTGVVADVMTPVVHSVTERASLDSVARLMTRKRIHRVMVRKGQRVTGVISALDVLKAQRPSRAKPKATVKAKAKPKATVKAKAKPKATVKAKAKPKATVKAKAKPKATVKAKPKATVKAKAKPKATVKARTKAAVKARAKPPLKSPVGSKPARAVRAKRRPGAR